MFKTCGWTVLVALCLAVGCKAQPGTQTPGDPSLDRKIEVMVRSQFNVPQDFKIQLGARTPSKIAGFDDLPVMLERGSKTTTVHFLLSQDNKTLARLETFDLSNNPALNIDVTGRPIRGNPAAKVTVVNFDDLECPFCARMHEALFPDTLEHYKNQVRFIYKDDPLTDLHPWAMHAAVDANCIAAQNGDAYWAYVDYVHSHGQEITGPDRNLTKSFATLDRLAREQGTQGKLDSSQLDDCITRQDETKIKESAKEADALGVDGTPALFIDGERVNGAIPEQQLWMVIDRALRAAGEQPPTEPDAPAGATKGR